MYHYIFLLSSSYYLLFLLFKNYNGKTNKKLMQPGCKLYFLQFEQTPFTTIFTLSSEKLLGRFIVGTGISFKQKV